MQMNQQSQELKGEETVGDNPPWLPMRFRWCPSVLALLLREAPCNAFMHLGRIFLEH